jgi:hypothetical protein
LARLLRHSTADAAASFSAAAPLESDAMTMPRVLTEPRLSLSGVAKRVGVSFPTARRWRSHGVVIAGVRVKLEATRLGGQWVTSVEAVERFVAATNPEAAPPQQTPAARRKASADASKRLAAAGW